MHLDCTPMNTYPVCILLYPTNASSLPLYSQLIVDYVYGERFYL
jgi:hypothetical protein